MRNGMGKFRHNKRSKKNIPMAAAVLLCMTLFSTCCVSGIYAKYTTEGVTGGSAPVAKFSIVGEGTLVLPIEATLSPGKSAEAPLVIHNDSEVAVTYTINAAIMTNNLPLNLCLTKSGSTLTEQTGTNITLTDMQIPGSHTDNYTLKINWDGANKDTALMGKVDYIAVTVTAVQAD